MNEHYPALLVISPLISAFVISVAGWIDRRVCFPVAVLGLAVSTYTAFRLLLQVVVQGPAHYRLGGWDAPWGIAYHVDSLSGLVLVVVSSLALLNLIATRREVQKEFPDRTGAFYTLCVLFVTGLLGMVVTGDLFNLYVLLEVASLTSYALIALGKARARLASLNYVFLGTMGACFYLLGVGYLYIMTGSLNMADIASLLPRQYHSTAVLVAFIFCMVGIWIKMALFPLHVWLPNAYTYAPSGVSSLIAPLMTKVMAYVMIRLMLSVFTPAFVYRTIALSDPMVWLASAAILAGAFMALAQRDLKRMLTYVIVSEIGYMVGGAWLGNRTGMIGAVLHIMNDALMTLCLFLAAGTIAYRKGELGWERLRGLFRTMPYTMAALVAGGLSVIGVPPTCGFFSKWYLIAGAIQAGHFGFMGALVLSSLISAVLFFRVVEIGFFEGNPSPQGKESPKGRQEAPLEMLAPLLGVAAGLLVVGLFTGKIVNLVVQTALPERFG
jgi:multicomponent Na+:H+ antiporter subunit D